MAGDIRIIAGSARGRRLTSTPGQAVRPTSSRVREATFSILGAKVRGASVLDLFAGIGALGLEALSRGAEQVDFVEKAPRHAACIRTNLETLGFTAQGRVWVHDVAQTLARGQFTGAPYDLVFLDPPYAPGAVARLLPPLLGADIIAPSGVVVAEHPQRDVPEAPGWETGRTYRYGKTSVTLLYPAT